MAPKKDASGKLNKKKKRGERSKDETTKEDKSTKKRRKSDKSASIQRQQQQQQHGGTFEQFVDISTFSAQERAELIAEACESVLEDPMAAFRSGSSSHHHQSGTNHTSKIDDDDNDHRHDGPRPAQSKMRLLLELADPQKNNDDYITSKLAVMSLLAVFQDIVPSYRIRLPTQEELSVPLSRETRQLWTHERSLLTTYKSYLNLLLRLWNGGSGAGRAIPSSRGSLSMTCMLCLCQLLQSIPHFNFRSDLLSAIVGQMNSTSFPEISTACSCAISHLFIHDTQGDWSLEAVRLICKSIKDGLSSSKIILPQTLQTFLSLPLRVHADEAEAAKLAAAAAQKQKRKRSEEAQIEAEMKEAQATSEKMSLARNQADMLHAITLIYFRIVKSADCLSDGQKSNANDNDDSHNNNNNNNNNNRAQLQRKQRLIASLLPASLEGLGKFAHLIHMDTVVDLLAVLRGLLRHVKALPLDSSFSCIITAFRTLRGPGRELQIDPKEYIVPLYKLLPRLCTETFISNSNKTDIPSQALVCLDAAFVARTDFSTVRVASFARRLCDVSLHCPPDVAIPLLATSRRMLLRHESVASHLLEKDDDEEIVPIIPTMRKGLLKPSNHAKQDNDDDMDNAEEDDEDDDPDALGGIGSTIFTSGTTSSSLSPAWELSLLQFHVHSGIVKQTQSILSSTNTSSSLSMAPEVPQQLRNEWQQNRNDLYISYRMKHKRHPLSVEKRRMGRRNRRNNHQIRFITPRSLTEQHHLKTDSLW